jgi:hypothetical protein
LQAKQKAQGCRDFRAGSAPFFIFRKIAPRMVKVIITISIQHRRPYGTTRHTDKTYRLALSYHTFFKIKTKTKYFSKSVEKVLDIIPLW